MTWTPKDTEALREESRAYAEWASELADGGSVGTSEDARLAKLFAGAAAELERRGAEIERLEARVTDALTLIDAGKSSGLMRRNPPGRKLLDAVRAVLADEIDRMVALEADLTNSIPRDELVRALDLFRLAEWNDAPQGNERLWAMRAKVETVLQKLTDAARSGTFPPKEPTP